MGPLVGLGLLVALQKRIALKLGLDIGLQLHARQLQQLDRLLQLRRQDKALALPEFKSGGERHGCPRNQYPATGTRMVEAALRLERILQAGPGPIAAGPSGSGETIAQID